MDGEDEKDPSPFICPTISDIVKHKKPLAHFVLEKNQVSIDVRDYDNKSRVGHVAERAYHWYEAVKSYWKKWRVATPAPGDLKIRLWLQSTYNKSLPLSGSSSGLVPCAFNTGETDFRLGRITIWRNEEWEKVLVHELVHWFGFENKIMSSSNKVAKQQDETFRQDVLSFVDTQKRGLLTFEAFTETLAIYMYHRTLWTDDQLLSFTRKQEKGKEKPWPKYWASVLQLNFNNTRQLYQHWHSNWSESTSVASYHLLKTALLIYWSSHPLEVSALFHEWLTGKDTYQVEFLQLLKTAWLDLLPWLDKESDQASRRELVSTVPL